MTKQSNPIKETVKKDVKSVAKKTAVKKKSAARKTSVKKGTPSKVAVKKSSINNKTTISARKSQPVSVGDVEGEVIVLDSVVTINKLCELKQLFMGYVDYHDRVSINASAVSKIDTASLQMLLSFAVKRQLQYIPVEWISPSDVLISQAKTLGLSDLLNMVTK